MKKLSRVFKMGNPSPARVGGLLPLIKKLAEAAFEAELDSHIAQEVSGNQGIYG